jgi:hypothetical protein
MEAKSAMDVPCLFINMWRIHVKLKVSEIDVKFIWMEPEPSYLTTNSVSGGHAIGFPHASCPEHQPLSAQKRSVNGSLGAVYEIPVIGTDGCLTDQRAGGVLGEDL